MNDIFSSQRITNIILVALVAVALFSVFNLETKLTKMQKSLNYIGGNTEEAGSSLRQIADDTKYIQISTEATVNALER